jgi:hypothetical protein
MFNEAATLSQKSFAGKLVADFSETRRGAERKKESGR